MVERFKQHLKETGLILDEGPILVGYSGGADSTALLVLLHESGVDCIAAHLHHGMRPEAQDELNRCEAFAATLGIPFVSGRADIPAMSRNLKIGIEEAGRHARMTFFNQSALQTGCKLVATGHTQDDLVETVLMNLARGSGLTGLSGIRPLNDGLLRPLLPFTRQETRDFCIGRGLWFHDDPGNIDESFTRVRIRRRLVPEFHAINPQFSLSVARMAQTVQEEDAFLDNMAAHLLEQCELPLNGQLKFLTQDVEACFNRQALASAPPALAKRAIRLAAGFFGAALDFDNTQVLWSSILEPGSKISVTSNNTAIEVGSDRVAFRSLAEFEPFRFPLTMPGVTESEVFGWMFTSQSIPPTDYERPPGSLEAVFDLGRAKGGLHFRAAQSGDEMIPLGSQAPRKVLDLMAKAKLTSAARRRLPIICDMAGPIWIPGVRLADRVRVGEGTTRAISVRFGPLEWPEGHNDRNATPDSHV